MKVLVACEFSGIVREAFIKKGHYAVSCDLLDTWIKGPHFKCDVLDKLYIDWDLMIAHPPCTYLCVSGIHWNNRIEGRSKKTEEALEFVQKLMDANIPKIAIENPIGVISTRIRKPDQIIQPWQFGHPESKATCLWLKGLPKLVPTDILPKRKQWENQTPTGNNKLGQTKDRWMKRSLTYVGIANAMAEQWG
jgi:hypothetical protein